MSKIPVFMLAKSPSGDVVLVQGHTPVQSGSAEEGDFSGEISAAERKLTSLGYTVLGSFLSTDPAAQLVDLAGCQQVF